MLRVSNLYLCVLSISTIINGGLAGKKPFEELHFKQSVFYILDIRQFNVLQRLGLAKHSFQN